MPDLLVNVGVSESIAHLWGVPKALSPCRAKNPEKTSNQILVTADRAACS